MLMPRQHFRLATGAKDRACNVAVASIATDQFNAGPLSAVSEQNGALPRTQRCANRRHRGSERAVAANSVLDHSHDNVRLNFGSNLATSVSVRDLGRGVVGCSLQLTCISGFDLVA
jgi:hypothetical protein